MSITVKRVKRKICTSIYCLEFSSHEFTRHKGFQFKCSTLHISIYFFCVKETQNIRNNADLLDVSKIIEFSKTHA